jgi:hypothetical protein
MATFGCESFILPIGYKVSSLATLIHMLIAPHNSHLVDLFCLLRCFHIGGGAKLFFTCMEVCVIYGSHNFWQILNAPTEHMQVYLGICSYELNSGESDPVFFPRNGTSTNHLLKAAFLEVLVA